MNQRHGTTIHGSDPTAGRVMPPYSTRGLLSRRFPATDMQTWLMLLLVALGLPRTVLADLDIVALESSLLYYVLALTPFAAWLVMAIARTSRRPFMDFLVLGLLYGLSLVVVCSGVSELRWGTTQRRAPSTSPNSLGRGGASSPCVGTRVVSPW